MSTAPLPRGLEQAFTVAAAELGMVCAAWVFTRNVALEAQDAGVAALRDALGRTFPVLDAICERWLAGARAPTVDARAAADACAGANHLVVVGLEAFFLDALLQEVPGAQVALLRSSTFDVDWERVLANFGSRVTTVGLEDFQSLAGPKSALLTFAYGAQGTRAHVPPSWLRVTGEDVRTQFRSLVAWDALGGPMFVYPRWLVEVDATAFTRVVTSEAGAP